MWISLHKDLPALNFTFSGCIHSTDYNDIQTGVVLVSRDPCLLETFG